MTFENVSILVPYKSDNGYRDINWNWVLNRYKTLMPEAEICIGEYFHTHSSKSEAVNNAAIKATRDIFIIADADIIFDIEDMKRAINMLSQYKLIIPYSKFIKFDEIASRYILFNVADISIPQLQISPNNFEFYYDSSQNNVYDIIGGINIIKRESFIECGGFDERFKGWGREDDAFVHIAKYLYGNYGRPSDVTMYHLFHHHHQNSNIFLNENSNLLFDEYQYYNVRNLNKVLEYKRNQMSIKIIKNKIK